MLSGLISLAKQQFFLVNNNTPNSRDCFTYTEILWLHLGCVIHYKCARVGGQHSRRWWSAFTSGLGAGGLNSKHFDRLLNMEVVAYSRTTQNS